MTTAHHYLQTAASLALQGQNDVLQGVPHCADDAHREALVKASGLFNQVAQQLYKLLGQLERDEESGDHDDDGEDATYM